jgi:hypothetical protein
MPGTITFPLDCFVALEVGQQEITVSGYTRLPITLTYSVDPVLVSNPTSLQWQHATADWGTIDHVSFWSTQLAGQRIGTLPVLAVTDPVTIVMYDIARIPAGGIVVETNNLISNRPFGRGRWGTYAFGTYAAFGPVPIGFGIGGFGQDGYAAVGDARPGWVVLERAFDVQQHVCAPGVWAPGPFAKAA